MSLTKKKRLPPKAANFQVDARLAVLLGESYTSTERALKELVDNAWDADADNIRITLPEPMTTDPIVVDDDGSGMTEQELRREYLFIANDRRSRKGELTVRKRRQVKGRKGVGKFAGLCAAQIMDVSTKARGLQTAVTIDRAILQQAGKDIERVPLAVTVSESPQEKGGTTIVLRHLDQNLNFPTPDKLRQLLIRDYGREEGIAIYVNGKRLGMDDVGGTVTVREGVVHGVGTMKLRFTVAEDKTRLKGAGIVVRVQGKVVGKPTFLGLDDADDFPRSLLGQIYGEIEADGLANDVTADFAAIIENSKAYDALKAWVVPQIREQVSVIYRREMQLAQARLKQKINRRLAELPEYKRDYADKALTKLLHKYYGETEDRLEPIVNVVLDALERDDYRYILEKIDDAKDSDITIFAQALEQFGLVDLALMAQQARQRKQFLEYLDRLNRPGTDELIIHKAIEQNLWLLGNEYGLLASNSGFKRIIQDALGKVYVGERAKQRPDLLLAGNILQQHVLIEFKKPAAVLSHSHYQQATRYRHELSAYLPPNIEVWLVGGRRDDNALPVNREPGIKLVTYSEIIANAQRQLDWLLKELVSNQ